MTDKQSQQPRITVRKPDAYKQDDRNHNQGSRRGARMIRQSYQQYGPVAAWVAAADDVLIGGNQSQKAALTTDAIQEVWELEVPDGVQVVVKKGVTSDDPKAREIAVALNRTGQVSFTADVEQLLADQEQGAKLDTFYRADELEAMLEAQQAAAVVEQALDEEVAEPGSKRKLGDARKQIKAVLYVEQVDVFERALKATGLSNRGAALLTVCQAYLEQVEADFTETFVPPLVPPNMGGKDEL